MFEDLKKTRVWEEQGGVQGGVEVLQGGSNKCKGFKLSFYFFLVDAFHRNISFFYHLYNLIQETLKWLLLKIILDIWDEGLKAFLLSAE